VAFCGCKGSENFVAFSAHVLCAKPFLIFQCILFMLALLTSIFLLLLLLRPPPLRVTPARLYKCVYFRRKAHHIWWFFASVYQNDIANLPSRSECYDSYTYFLHNSGMLKQGGRERRRLKEIIINSITVLWCRSQRKRVEKLVHHLWRDFFAI
jgi:hypothetical protein